MPLLKLVRASTRWCRCWSECIVQSLGLIKFFVQFWDLSGQCNDLSMLVDFCLPVSRCHHISVVSAHIIHEWLRSYNFVVTPMSMRVWRWGIISCVGMKSVASLDLAADVISNLMSWAKRELHHCIVGRGHPLRGRYESQRGCKNWICWRSLHWHVHRVSCC